MNKKAIDKLLLHPVSWLANSNPNESIAISSRIRLARNLSGLTFPINSSESEQNKVLSIASSIIRKNKILDNVMEFNINSLSDIDRCFLLERHLMSRDFCKEGSGGRCLMINEAESCSIMINEEDHMRTQLIQPGLSLQSIWTVIDKIDNRLSKNISFAYNKTLGYLTSCPTNVGTGMRASVMLNLPGLVLAGHLDAVVRGISKLGIVVRGLYGEGSECVGNLYQVSNQSTLGESEPQIIQRLKNIIQQIINHEKNARLKLLETKQNFLQDHIGRAYGVMRYSYILSSKEALNSLSILRMGVDMKMFTLLDINSINELFISTQPAHLQKYSLKKLTLAERDTLRAKIVREKLQKSS
jgi:protein arginine kinase